MNAHSVLAARLSCGGVVDAVGACARGGVRNALCVVRPPGHHAEAHCAMGFCLLNNVAVAVAAALEANPGRVRRVLVVDWDVHHGNGIQHIFYDDPRVLYFSVHRFDRGRFYPCSREAGPDHVGRGPGLGATLNVGWNRAGAGDAEYLAAWREVLMPVAYAFQPDLVVRKISRTPPLCMTGLH